MPSIRITAADAFRDFKSFLARAQAGAEVIIEDNASPAVVLHLAAERPSRLLSESVRHAKNYPSSNTLDIDFARDLEAAITCHPESVEDPWD